MKTKILSVWFTTIILSPILIVFSWNLIFEKELGIVGSIQMLFLTTIIGFAFSIPTMLVLAYLEKINFAKKNRKTVLSLFSIMAIFTTFYIVDPIFVSNHIDQTIFPIIYSSVMSLSIFRVINSVQTSHNTR